MNLLPSYYLNRYYSGDDLSLPHSPRTYFDSFASEYTDVDIQSKLLDIAFLHIHGGYDIREAIHKLLLTHSYISEDCVRQAVVSLIGATVGSDVSWRMNDGQSLDTEISVLLYELRRRYILPLCDSSRQHLICHNDVELTRNDILDSNGWALMVKNQHSGKTYGADRDFCYPGDRPFIDRINKQRPENSQICVNVYPEPWYGNPMTAKLIIIGEIPIYDDFIHRAANILLNNYPQLSEGVLLHLINTLSLNASTLYPRHRFWEPDVNYIDAYNSVGYRFWIKRLREFALTSNILIDTLMKNVAIINPFPYVVQGRPNFKFDFSHNDHTFLPSHHFLRRMLNYLHAHTDALLLFPHGLANDDYFRYVTDDIWSTTISNYMMTDRLIRGRLSNKSNALTPRGLGVTSYRRLVSLF